MQITFNLPHVFYPGAPTVENAYALRILLDCLINLNLAYLRFNKAPELYRSGVRYARTTVWETIPALYERKFGDCKSLASALIAQYRLAGIACEPVFRWVRPDGNEGTTDFHILVQTAVDFEDPSKVLGMGQNENAPFYEAGSVIEWNATQGLHRL